MSDDVKWIADEAAFAGLASEWEELLPEDASPFDLHCWYATWWSAFGGSDRLAVCTLRRDGRLAAVFPLRETEGGRLASMANSHSSRFRPLGVDRSALDALSAAVMEKATAGFELGSLPISDPCLGSLTAEAGGGGLLPFVEPQYVSPAVEMRGEYEAWRQGSKPRWGAPLERFRRKMGRDHDATMTIVEPPTDLEADLDAGFAVEASGWKGREGTAILSEPETEAFYRGLGRVFGDRGELYLSGIALDGQLAAFDFCLLHDRRLYLLKTGYDERFRKLAPGLVMRLSIVERCFEMDLLSHELLGRDSEWKEKFANVNREFALLRTFPRSPAGLARRAYRGSIRPSLKRGYRRLRPGSSRSPTGGR